MNDNIKTTLSIIGTIFIVLFTIFCVAMHFPTFKNNVNDILDIIPKNKYDELVDEKDNLHKEIESYSQ